MSTGRPFEAWRRAEPGCRLVLFTTKGGNPYLDHPYRADDILLFGRESAGVPDDVVAAADARLVIPIKPGLRSLNVAVAAPWHWARPCGKPVPQPWRRRVELRGQGDLS